MTADGALSADALPRVATSEPLLARLGAALTEPRMFFAYAAAAVAVILPLASTLSFLGDEWSYIVDRRLTFESMLQPHNEHLAFLHVLVYRGMVELIGIGSYLPFLAVLLAIHVSAAGATYVLLLRHVSRAMAMAATVLFLFLGAGFDNLVWAFQIGFVGAIAFGVWALVAADRGHPWIAAALGTASIWTQSDGLFFLLPLFVLLRNRVPLVMPLVTYGAWYLVIGRGTVPLTLGGDYLAYAVTAVGSGVGGVLGIGAVLGLGAAIAAAVWLGARVVLHGRDGRLEPIVLAGIAGLFFEYAILTVARAHFGADQALAPRYVYAAAPFLFMLLPGLPRLPRAVWAAIFVFALGTNLLAIPYGVATYQAFLHYDRSLTLEQRLAPFR